MAEEGAPSQAQRYLEALSAPGLRLRFAAALEKEYLGGKDERSVRQLRLACAGIVVFYAIFFALDYATQRLLAPLEHGLILAALVALGGTACYVLELIERRNWLSARLVEEMAIRDELTGLYSRRYFYEQGELVLRQAQREGKPVGLLLVDVDEFRRYNDSLGHVAGDDCLRKIAAVLRESAQRPLDLVARLGGEEFALLLFDIGEATLHQRAEHTRAQIEGLDIAHPASHRRFVSLSIGSVAARGGTAPPLDSLVALADHALYAAKAAGRNRVVGAVA